MARSVAPLPLALALLVLLLTPVWGGLAGAAGPERAPGSRVSLRASDAVASTRIGSPPARSAQAVTFVVNYNAGFQAHPAARAAFQRAVDIWASQLTSPVPIVVDATWTPLEEGLLGSAGFAYSVRNFAGAPQSGTFYPAAVANKLAGTDLYPGEVDIQATFNSSVNWYFGTDGNVPAGQYDFVTVVLHELGHGLGVAGSATVQSGLGYHGTGVPATPLVWDRLVVDGLGLSILTFPSGSATLAAQLTGQGLYFSGASAVAANGGTRPRLFAPPDWQQGSSYSHLDEATYPAGSANSLMTPRLSQAEAVHDPGPIARGMLSDMGWTTQAGSGPTATPTASPTRTPATTPTPTPTGAAGGVLFSDDFSSSRGWSVGASSDGRAVAALVGNAYNTRLLASGLVWAIFAPHRPSQPNVSVEVDVAIAAGAAGLSFGGGDTPDRGYYAFSIHPSTSHAALWRFDGEGWALLGQSYTAPVTGGVDRLRVRREAGSIRASVNGSEVVVASDATLSGGAAGVYVEAYGGDTSADATFDNFVLASASAASATPTPVAASPTPTVPSRGSSRARTFIPVAARDR